MLKTEPVPKRQNTPLGGGMIGCFIYSFPIPTGRFKFINACFPKISGEFNKLYNEPRTIDIFQPFFWRSSESSPATFSAPRYAAVPRKDTPKLQHKAGNNCSPSDIFCREARVLLCRSLNSETNGGHGSAAGLKVLEAAWIGRVLLFYSIICWSYYTP